MAGRQQPSGAFPSAAFPGQGSHNNYVPTDGSDSEWEYEYSTTETEDHYVTLDISIPEIINRRDQAVQYYSRSGYRSWLSRVIPGRENQNSKRVMFEDELDNGEEAGMDEENDDDREEEDDELDPAGEPHNVGAEAEADAALMEDEDGPKDIQILELHSGQPIVSYRGMVFRGEWTQTIGTELLFVKHTADDPLPIQQHLPQGVDLLGASSARLTCTQTQLRPRHLAEQSDRMKKVRKTNGFMIDVTADTTDERRPQADFLEQLMAVKKAKGEKDAVTVYATDPSKRAGPAREEGQPRRRRARKPLKDVAKESRNQARGRGQRGWSRRRGGSARGHDPTPYRWERLPSGNVQLVNDSMQSTPTPTRWDDLRPVTEEEEEEEEEDDEDMEGSGNP